MIQRFGEDEGKPAVAVARGGLESHPLLVCDSALILGGGKSLRGLWNFLLFHRPRVFEEG